MEEKMRRKRVEWSFGEHPKISLYVEFFGYLSLGTEALRAPVD